MPMTTGTTTWSPMSRIRRDVEVAGLSLSQELLREPGLNPLVPSLTLPNKSLLTAEMVPVMEDGPPELTRPSLLREDGASMTAMLIPRPRSPHTGMDLP